MRQTEKIHSKLGIASCVIAAVMFFVFLLAIFIYNAESGFGFSFGHGELAGDARLLNIVILMFFPIPVHAIGLILGVTALFFPNRKKLFPVAGVLSNLIFGLSGLFPWAYLAVASLGRVQ